MRPSWLAMFTEAHPVDCLQQARPPGNVLILQMNSLPLAETIWLMLVRNTSKCVSQQVQELALGLGLVRRWTGEHGWCMSCSILILRSHFCGMERYDGSAGIQSKIPTFELTLLRALGVHSTLGINCALLPRNSRVPCLCRGSPVLTVSKCTSYRSSSSLPALKICW